MNTPILNMTDGEYRYFREYQDDCFDYDPCTDSQLVWLRGKLISEMNRNESDYFADRGLDCENINPCSSIQYLSIKNKVPFEMSHEEYRFYQQSIDDCKDYSPDRKRTHRFKRILFITLGIITLAAGGIVAYTFPARYQ